MKTKITENGICHICGGPYKGFGNNPEPLYPYECRVCKQCNDEYVLPARLRVHNARSSKRMGQDTDEKLKADPMQRIQFRHYQPTETGSERLNNPTR
jgi:hypothetical protein